MDKSEHRGIPVARLGGDVEAVSCPSLTEDLLEAADPGTKCLIVDLSEVTYIDSGAMGCLLDAHGKLTSQGGVLVLVCCNPPLEHLLAETGFEKILGVFETLDDAVGALPACRPA